MEGYILIKNYCLTILNIIIAGLPMLFIWEPKIYFCYFGSMCLFILLSSWNPLGEIVIILNLRAKKILRNQDMFFALNQYLKYLLKNNLIEEQCSLYYTNIKFLSCFPISRKKLIVPLSMEDYIINKGTQFLISYIPKERYEANLMFSRRVLLLSIVGYAIVLRFIELWAIFFAFAVRVIFALVMVIATGSIFESAKDVGNAISFGTFLGNIAVKINDIVNSLQDKIINLIMTLTMENSIKSLE